MSFSPVLRAVTSAPLAGVPYHAVDDITVDKRRLVIAEQSVLNHQREKIVPRAARVVTAGILSSLNLSEKRNNYNALKVPAHGLAFGISAPRICHRTGRR
jgi:hypothetical protein